MNLATLIDGHPDGDVALVSRGRPTTYGSLAAQVASLRGAFAARGVGAGDTVALLCGNSRYFVVSYLAALGVGAAVAPLNPTSPAPEIDKELLGVTPKMAVVEPSAHAVWRQLPETTRSSVSLVVSTEGHDLPGALAIEDLLVHAPVPVVDVEPSHHAVYMFTSGTAGAPRAAVLTHGNLLANIQQSRVANRIEKGDVVFGVLPLFHIFGLNVMLAAALYGGATVVLVQRFDPLSAVETFEERAVTVVPGAPSMWAAFSQMDTLPVDTFSRVRLALSGAAKLPEQVAHDLHTRFGLKVWEGYGLTEASPVVTTSLGGRWIPGSIGRPVPGVELRVVDENGEDVLAGDAGEILVRGNNVFVGYLNDPEATARVLTPDGWLLTGDIATIDDDGHLFMVDRAKDLIIVSGFNVYPGEVEDALSFHPDIEAAAVVGTPHPHTGETVRAYVVTRPGAHLDEDSVVDHCRARLARYKCPTKVLFVDELPRTATGKVRRHALS